MAAGFTLLGVAGHTGSAWPEGDRGTPIDREVEG